MAFKSKQEAISRAREIAAAYRIIIEPARTEGYIGRSIELPKVFAHAKTRECCLIELEDNLIDAVAAIMDMGRVPPRPNEQRLTEQVNVRLTSEEKCQAEQRAQEEGFRGLSDYTRALLAKQVRQTSC